MNCQNFETLWNELLDGGDAASAERERELEAHAAQCAACRAVSTRYQTLRTAMRSMGPPPAPSPEFAGRCLEAWEQSVAAPTFRLTRHWPSLAGLAAAAALFAVISLGIHSGWLSSRGGERAGGLVANPPAEPARPQPEAIAPSRPLTVALADATSATWALAREASAPAARIGRDVIDQTVNGDETAIAEPASPLNGAASAASAVAVIQSVGSRVNEEGVRPLSGSARHAFSFLLAPAAEEPEPNASF